MMYTTAVVAQQTDVQEAQTMDADSTDMQQKKKSFDGQKFMKETASAGMMEVELGKMASEKASSEEVKQFGQTMVEDHTKANEELKALASSSNVTIPESMNEKHQKTVDKLSALSGEEFDQEYMKTMLKDHKKDIEKFQKAAEKADSEKLKAWAEKTIPVLEEHHQLAKETQQTVQASLN